MAVTGSPRPTAARPSAAHCPLLPVLPPAAHPTTMPHDDALAGGQRSWMSRWSRALAAETLGTALLVLLGCACVQHGGSLGAVALGWGALVTALAAALGPVSGAHLNPAVTLGAMIMRALPVSVATAYVLCQCVGALLGYSALWALDPALTAVTVTRPVGALTGLQAAGVEAVLTGTLLLVVCSLWTGAPDPTGPLRVGLCVTALVVAGGGLSGAALNPARSVAPALVHGLWDAHWVYWLGPLGGAGAAAALCRWVLSPPAAAAAPDAALPLHDVKQDD